MVAVWLMLLARPFLVSGDDVYVPAPPNYVASYGVAVRWARDSGSFVYQTGDLDLSVAATRQRVAQQGDDEVLSSQLVRWNVQTARNEFLATATDDTYFGDVALVGTGGDVIFEVRRVDAQRGQLTQIWFGAVGKKAGPISEWMESSNATLICSTRQRKAFFATKAPDGLRVYAISESGVRTVPGLSDWQFATFTGNTKKGTAVLAVGKVGANDKSTSAVIQINYDSLVVVPIGAEARDFDVEDAKLKPFRVSEVAWRRNVATEGADVLRDIELASATQPDKRLVFASGATALYEMSPDGRKLAYPTPNGLFVRELVKVDAVAAARLRGG
jgi:hypothetical protein